MNCSEGSRAATLCGFSIGVDAGVGAGMGALMATASAGAVTGVAFAILFPFCVLIETKLFGKSTVIFPAIVAYGLSVGLTIGIFALAGASVAFGGIALAGLATAVIGVGIFCCMTSCHSASQAPKQTSGDTAPVKPEEEEVSPAST